MSDIGGWIVLAYLVGIPVALGVAIALDDDPDAYIPIAVVWPLAAIVFASACATAAIRARLSRPHPHKGT